MKKGLIVLMILLSTQVYGVEEPTTAGSIARNACVEVLGRQSHEELLKGIVVSFIIDRVHSDEFFQYCIARLLSTLESDTIVPPLPDKRDLGKVRQ